VEKHMTDYLAYWVPFWDDTEGDLSVVVHNWFTNRKYFFGQVKPGDNIWVVVTGGSRHSDEWRLLQRVYVRALEYKKGEKFSYWAVGDDDKSELFDPDEQIDFAPMLRKLKFASGKRITGRGRKIGTLLRAIRPLSDSDVVLLQEYAHKLIKFSQKSYWLFQVMYDWFPESWQKMIEAGVAAENYCDGSATEHRNTEALKQLKQGDAIVAAFKRHRFAGYGTLTSDYYRGGPPLNVVCSDRIRDFYERFDCDWTTLPFQGDQVFIDCSDLKSDGFDIDMKRGLCVKQIDEDTFRALKTRLDEAGAKRFIPLPQIEATVVSDLDSIRAEGKFVEGKKSRRFTNQYERNPRLRAAAILYHGTKCMTCGFDFGEVYGEHGVGYIEVHHLKPVSSLKKQIRVDPKTDMAVVCSNCHRMIHRRKDNVLSVEELKQLVRK
jgi:hypothetical protein